MATLEIRNLNKSFTSTPVVSDLSLDIASGEFVSLLGPSGCGKSTSLAMIAGFEQPDSGTISVDGVVINDLAPRFRSIGVVLQDYAVFPRMSVAQNIAFGLAARGVGRAERDQRVTSIADRLRIGELLHHRGAALDLSDMQRVAIARTLVTEPAILLLDEPLSNLDASVRVALRGELKSLQREFGQTVLFVTHDQAEAMTMSDSIAIMDGGRIVQSGTPRALYDRPNGLFVANFLGDPPINILPAVLRRDGEATLLEIAPFAPVAWQGGGRTGNIFVGIRPHGLTVARHPSEGSVEALVDDIEHLGATGVLHLRLHDIRMRALVARTRVQCEAFAAGDRVDVSLDTAGAVLIDAATGAAQ